ncbi:hypothetical protein [Alteribacillus sp. HJP-4]|uniref:hypothetical protein n=1 Tax=Alteribacillus sp. HJP-4 TaxID=2775394 RepID=UPI0035CD3A16
MSSSTPDFAAFRREKQQNADENLIKLLTDFEQWLGPNTNLREKVRAKHIFAEKVKINVDEVDQPGWSVFFEDWFAFDYITVIGTHLFDMFIKKQADKLSAPELQLAGLVMTSVLEPLQIKENHDQLLETESLQSGERKTVSLLPKSMFSIDVKEEWLLVRSVYCGFQHRIISNPAPLELTDFILPLTPPLETERSRQLTSMKEHGLLWLRQKK